MRRCDGKSRKINVLHDEHRTILEKKKAETDCAILRQRYDAVTLEEKQKVGRDYDVLRKESGVQTHDLNTPQHKHGVLFEEKRDLADAYAAPKRQYEE